MVGIMSNYGRDLITFISIINEDVSSETINYYCSIDNSSYELIWVLIDITKTNQLRRLTDNIKFKQNKIIPKYYGNSFNTVEFNKVIEKVNTRYVSFIHFDEKPIMAQFDKIYDYFEKYLTLDLGGICLSRVYNEKFHGKLFFDNFSISTYEKVRFIDDLNYKAYVWKTSIFRKYPLIEFDNEKFFPLEHNFISISGDSLILLVNFPLTRIGKVRIQDRILFNYRFYSNPYGALTYAILTSNPYYSLKYRISGFYNVFAYSVRLKKNLIVNLMIADYSLKWFILLPLVIILFSIESLYYSIKNIYHPNTF